MRRYALLLSLVAVAGCGPAGVRAPRPVYRYINVVDGQLRLGEPFRRFDLAERIDDTTYALRPGTFGGGGTEAITAHTDARGVLRGLTFVYDGSEPLATKVRDYTASLGPPAEVRAGGDGASVHVWQDAETRFELHHAPRGRPPFWSRLTDRRRAAGAG
ncbi:MAG TPA: hypothetical protein VF746_15630 [Longimicrobium sp.]|jgi:hypothetical protein